MRLPAAYRAIVELERRSSARLWSLHAHAASLARDRANVIALNVVARKALFASPNWSSIQCYALVAHTVWTAGKASALASAQRREIAHAASLAGERMHWARCRRGLERRHRSLESWRV